jgi:hypothetical protein
MFPSDVKMYVRVNDRSTENHDSLKVKPNFRVFKIVDFVGRIVYREISVYPLQYFRPHVAATSTFPLLIPPLIHNDKQKLRLE